MRYDDELTTKFPTTVRRRLTCIFARVRKTFHVELPLRALFEEPTIAGRSLEIQKAKQNGAQVRVPPLTRRTTASEGENLLAKLDELSDEEASSLLSTLLAQS